MIDEVGDLSHRVLLHPVLGGDDGLGALLAHLLEDLVGPLFEEVAGVGALLGIGFPVQDHLIKVLQNSIVHCSPSMMVLKKQLRAPV